MHCPGLPAARATGIAAAAADRWDVLPAPARAALTRQELARRNQGRAGRGGPAPRHRDRPP